MGSLEEEVVWRWTEALEEEHAEWCRQHEINPTAARSIAALIESTVHVFYRCQFEPKWLRCANPTPIWKCPTTWEDMVKNGWDMFQKVYAHPELLCYALTCLCQHQFGEALTDMFRMLGLQPLIQNNFVYRSRGPVACIHFLAGNCKFRTRCRSAHSFEAKRPPCRFFQQGSCTKGKSCPYDHEQKKNQMSFAIGGATAMDAVVPLQSCLFLSDGPIGWFRAQHRQMMLLGEGDFKFASALMSIGLVPAAA